MLISISLSYYSEPMKNIYVCEKMKNIIFILKDIHIYLTT